MPAQVAQCGPRAGRHFSTHNLELFPWVVPPPLPLPPFPGSQPLVLLPAAPGQSSFWLGAPDKEDYQWGVETRAPSPTFSAWVSPSHLPTSPSIPDHQRERPLGANPGHG